jgi:hypothetical protein
MAVVLDISMSLDGLVTGPHLFDRLGPETIELERTRVIESPLVTHLRFRVLG